MPDGLHIRPAAPGEREALLWRFSRVHVQHRRDLDEHPDAIALTPNAIEESRLKVATAPAGTLFAVGSTSDWASAAGRGRKRASAPHSGCG
jgi:hypothetical protein